MSDATVSAAYAAGLLRLAEQKGADRTALCASAGVDPHLLADPDHRIPFGRYAALMREAKAATGDPAMGLHYGETIDIATISIVGLIGQASATMQDAFVQLNRYIRLVVDVEVAGTDRFVLQQTRGGLWVVDARRNPNEFPELTESAFAQLVCGPRALGVPRIVLAVHVTHSEPSYGAEYTRILQAPVTFDGNWNALQIDPAIMAHRVERLPAYVFGVLTDRADTLLAELDRSKTIRGEVERQLLTTLHTGSIDMNTIAAQLGVSRQTLYRKLKAEGATFETILDTLRMRLALDYLRAGRISVTETAYLVGFSDPAAFSRAFKRWTGHNPRDYRDDTR
jgi:AraC-like DNA-binding protein